MLLITIFAIRGLSYIILHYSNNLAVLYTFAVIFGFVDYSVVPPVISLTQQTLGEETMGLAVGILLMFHSGGAAVGAYVGGVIYDRYGNYALAEALCGGLCASAAAVLFFLPHEPLRRSQLEVKHADSLTNKSKSTSVSVNASTSTSKVKTEKGARDAKRTRSETSFV